MKPTSLVSRFLKSIYFTNSNILNPSYLWRSLLWGRDLLKKGVRYRIGNGEDVAVFGDPWIPKELTFKPICLNRDFLQVKVSHFINNNGEWNLDFLKSSMLEEDFNIIRGLPINLNAKDRLIWHFDKLGKYNVKSGYNLFLNNKLNAGPSSDNGMKEVGQSYGN